MIAVVCVYWKGVFRGRENIYTTDWVRKLQGMVARNCSLEHEFVCLTNDESIDFCKTIPLRNDWPGYWSKLELFRRGIFDDYDKVLYLDLDVVVLKDLRLLVDYADYFTLIGTGNGERDIKEGKILVRRYNSSVMCFLPKTEEIENLYRCFDATFEMNKMFGDQDYIGREIPHATKFPHKWVQKIRDLPEHKPTSDTVVAMCMCPGMPQKNEAAKSKLKWVCEIWI